MPDDKTIYTPPPAPQPPGLPTPYEQAGAGKLLQESQQAPPPPPPMTWPNT